ncbi:hypothetical protein [Paenibacillus sp. N3.4]|uniref:hypothetical protein n=1 Tax=Paenibacillus sp. N3.4 TaxID=2603222 RepID=UPI0011CB6ED5|nr:hypothetical protein [Paenibacillus sp. N3.4]TXK80351.1 hypothetical protein FU659_18725 [Paenibacillus sp. N3.4]
MRASLERHDGNVKIRINEELIDPISFRSFWPQAHTVNNFANSGVRLMSLFPTGVNCSLKVPYSQFGEIWVGDEQYQFENLRQQVDMFIENAPDAYFSLMIHLDTRDWFLEQNPDCADTFTHLAQSATYDKWRTSAARFMCDTIDYIDENYPEKLYGIFLLAGNTCEWFTRNDNGDYNASKEKAYQQWYNDDSRALPTYEELHHTSWGILRHPHSDKSALDYWHYHNHVVADTIAYFAQIAKTHTSNTRLVGLFYGYLMECTDINQSTWSFRQIINNDDIDILFTPASYMFRKLESTSAFMVPIDSISLHEKLYFHEIDNTTHLVSDNKYAQALQAYAHVKMDNLEQTVMYSKREAALAASKGMGHWWFDMFSGWFDDHELMQEIQKIHEATSHLYRKKMQSASQVAVFVDQESYYFPVSSANLGEAIIKKQTEELNRAGFPWDNYLMDDITHSRMPHDQYHFYIFLNLLAPKPEHLEEIKRLKALGKSMLFIYTAGLITEQGFSVEAMCELIGMNVEELDYSQTVEFKAHVPFGAYSDEKHGTIYGFDRPIKPMFHVRDEQAEPIGSYEKSGKTALAAKRSAHRFDAWSGLGPVPHHVLRQLAREAGVFIYSDAGEPVYVNRNMVGYYCHAGGQRTLHMPQDCKLHELYSGETINTVGRQANLSFAKDEMKLFEIVDS